VGLELVSSVLQIAVRSGTPLLLAAVGEIYAERSGVMNLGIEGMMLVGAITGFAVALATGRAWLGFLAACLAGLAMALIHALASVSLCANQVVSGLALASWFVLFKTRWGIVIRAVGDDPAAADAMGVDVHLVRYACVAFGGAMAGLAGAYLSLVHTPAWLEGMTAGRGWIAFALVVVSLWDPLKAIAGAYLFGATEALQFFLQTSLGLNAPLLGMLPYGATILAMLFAVSETMRKHVGAPAALGKPYIREERVI